MKEPAVKTIIRKTLAEMNKDVGDIWWFMPPANGYGRAGIPDFVFCVGGIFCAIEAKGEGGRITALQERELQRIRDTGGLAEVVDHKQDVETQVYRIVTTARLLARSARNQAKEAT